MAACGVLAVFVALWLAATAGGFEAQAPADTGAATSRELALASGLAVEV